MPPNEGASISWRGFLIGSSEWRTDERSRSLVVCSVRNSPKAIPTEVRIPLDFQALSSKALGPDDVVTPLVSSKAVEHARAAGGLERFLAAAPRRMN